MRRASSQKDLPDLFREISALDRSACVDRWREVFGAAPPKYLSVRFMQRVLARELQIRMLGDYPAQIRRALKATSGAAQQGNHHRARQHLDRI